MSCTLLLHRPAVLVHESVPALRLGNLSTSGQVSAEWPPQMSPSCPCPTGPGRSRRSPWHTGWSRAAGSPTVSQSRRRRLRAAGPPWVACHRSCPPLHPSCSAMHHRHLPITLRYYCHVRCKIMSLKKIVKTHETLQDICMNFRT